MAESILLKAASCVIINLQTEDTPMPTENEHEKIKRLLNLQGTDAGFFTLAVFSLIESFLRKIIPTQTKETTFYELIESYKEQSAHFHYDSYNQKYYANNKKIYSLMKDLVSSQFNTNEVRHKFGTLSEEEAIAAVALLEQFATIEKFTDINGIAKLSRQTDIWKNRMSPVDTAIELERANSKLRQLTKERDDMASRADSLQKIKVEYEAIIAKEKVAATEYEKAIEKNKANAEKIDALRKERHEQASANRALQKELAEKINALSDADEYITQLSRMASYTRTRYDFEQSLLRLTHEQQSIVNQIKFSKDFLIKGAAGTGKSVYY